MSDGLVDRAPPGSHPAPELRALLARINYFLHHDAVLEKVKEEMQFIWAPMTDVERRLTELEKFKEEFHADPFIKAARYLHGNPEETILTAGTISSAIALNLMIRSANSMGLETEVSVHHSGVIAIKVFRRIMAGEIKMPEEESIDLDE